MASDYAHEIRKPRNPRCGNLSLIFDGKVLKLTGGKTARSYRAASGMPGPAHLEGERHRHMQDKADLGPIPEGEYWIGLDEIQANWLGLRRNSASWGNYWIPIRVFPGTKTHGRGGFFIHGGKTPGSIGCIDLTAEMDDFVKDLRKETDGKVNCHIPLTVKYDFPKKSK